MRGPGSKEVQHVAKIDPDTGLIANIDEIRNQEYPNLSQTTYLDHAGTTLYPKSLIEAYAKELSSNILGNPHSASASSQLSSRRIDDVRLSILRFFNASPDDFDVVFVANATAAIKLVADAFRDSNDGFCYRYHVESHTSVVGVRELASEGSHCLRDDDEVEQWLTNLEQPSADFGRTTLLFAYPGQSNMTGRRLPLRWPEKIQRLRASRNLPVYSLLDAAALVSTAPLDLSNSSAAPDFTAVSFYKIFGFPDVGALIVRKGSGDILLQRKYFGGGTVDMVTMVGEAWHAKRETSLHTRLEDGTLPFHNIVALDLALDIHKRLYGGMANISRHANSLASKLRRLLRDLRHANGAQVCVLYPGDEVSETTQGPVVAFNLKEKQGKIVSTNEVEKLGIVKNIQFRTGGLCNPGSVATHLGLSADEMRRNYAAGQRCGGDNDIINGKPTGAIRVSFGAMSSPTDVATFVDFIKEFYVDANPVISRPTLPADTTRSAQHPADSFIVESLSVFPIKSCAAYKIPPDMAWEVGPKGLAWDREWCLVHQGTSAALSQKRYPRMALLRPEIDLTDRVLRVSYVSDNVSASSISSSTTTTTSHILELTLDEESPRHHHLTSLATCDATTTNKSSTVCGDQVDVQVYTAREVSDFFTAALGVPCTLARFPTTGTTRQAQVRVPGRGGGSGGSGGHHHQQATELGRSIALANESPILLVSRSSVNRLNEQIKQNGPGSRGGGGVGKAVAADSFRGNIVIAEQHVGGLAEHPYVEDEWTTVQIGSLPDNNFEILGPCQRCQMVCVDQKSAQRRQEPFSTLAKTRRRDGKVWFGMHMCVKAARHGQHSTPISIKVGDRVTPFV
ncbi:hypothetical protein PV08_04812 [Exophiala spinifera]|uniref:Molybdenum cofactor sulfurase n=1 Tax=Exophiala spinifera TaxID=91928 RepID=A0A0D1ZY93_9EURO|nr:uncharacterized protein PV08_04812 [Exophiala spinifera]KIW17617.1 hypothetical protein PV08_04812 [Exophiala spinifera]